MENKNNAAELADQFIKYTGQSLFLTGKAGTGKTTFLKRIKETVRKEIIIAAPTGVAAINAGGVTLHSLFQMPFKPFIPINRNSNSSNLNCIYKNELIDNIHFNKEKIQLLTALELLIIDEISMVRADMIDAIDVILKYVRNKPDKSFGGVQMLFIGDLFQLSPIAKNEEWEILKNSYKSPFFFNSNIIKENPPLIIELNHIYRQNDPVFINLLNNIRNNEISNSDLLLLDKIYDLSLDYAIHDGYITLTTHNHKADTINLQKLNELPGANHIFEAFISGNFDQKIYPVDKVISLKVGAQVMLIKNDKTETRRFHNGKIGRVAKIENENIWIDFPGESAFLLEKESWKNVDYKFDETEGKILEDVIGEFKQFPIRLAWAVTIHKSQGLTFEKAILDIENSFAPGQVYVALSRIKSLSGLLMSSKINPVSIVSNKEVLTYLNSAKQDENFLKCLLQRQKQIMLLEKIIDVFSWNDIIKDLSKHKNNYAKWNLENTLPEMKWEAELSIAIDKQQETVIKFSLQLRTLLSQASDGFNQFIIRVKDATSYFTDVIGKKIFPLLEINHKKAKDKKYHKGYIISLEVLIKELEIKNLELINAVAISELMTEKDNKTVIERLNGLKTLHAIRNSKEEKKTIKIKKKSSSSISTLKLFKDGISVNQIAYLRDLAVNTIEVHLADFIKTGELSIYELIPTDKVDLILNVLTKSNYDINAVKGQLGEGYSYFHIRAVKNHYILLSNQVITS